MPTELKMLISAEQIRRRVEELGEAIAKDHPHGTLCLVGVLKGSFMFLADLVRVIPRCLRLDFITAASYGAQTHSSGEVRLVQDVTLDISGCPVVVVEDIVDTGITLEFLLEHLRSKNPSSLRVAALLDKPSRHLRDVTIDYVGFRIGGEFVVGYGLDLAEEYRHLPDIYTVEQRPAQG